MAEAEKKPEPTLEERIFKLEQTVASLAGHPQPVAKSEKPST
jgi:hypothetical protein